jgi:alpha-tubulin suppressor-like RCC1 family protein
MALTKVSSTVIADNAITPAKISNDVSLGIKIANVSIANSTYDILDDTAISTDGGYIVITGSGFASGAQVLIEGAAANSTSFVSDSELRAQVPAKIAGSYNVYVVNSDGATGIRVNGLTYSANPAWVTGGTLDPQAVDVAFSVALDATDAVSYANSTALPAGTALLSNGYFYGTVTGIAEETTYTFTVVATDAENQDSPRTFSVTVTVGPPPEALYAWGYNASGQLGLNNTISVSSPIQVGTSTDWNTVCIGESSVLSLKDDNTLWSWGNNGEGQLGLGDTVSRSSPTQVGLSTDWQYVFIQTRTSLGLKTNGTLWSWGRNNLGQLGLNNVIGKSSPTQVGVDTNWQLVSASRYAQSAIKTDGTLWLWGRNNYGQLGLGDTISKSSPTQVGSATNWYKLSIGNHVSPAAIKTDGTLWMTGYNAVGQLGLNNRTNVSNFTQIGSDTNWKQISVGESGGVAAIKIDGTLWAWGRNVYGMLGLDDAFYRSSPTQVGTATDWNLVQVGEYNSIATKTDGTLWISGRNSGPANGNLGNGTTIDCSSPIQIGTSTNWSNVSVFYGTIATKTV